MAESLRQRVVEWARLSWVRRAAIAVYVLTLLGLIGVYIGISRVQVQTSVYLKGQPTFSTQHANPVRGLALHAPTGRKRVDMTANFGLVPAGDAAEPTGGASPDRTGRRSTEAHRRAFERAKAAGEVVASWSVSPESDGLVEAELDVPGDVEPGDYWLYLGLEASDIDSFVTRRRIEVVDRGFDALDPVPSRTFRLDRERRGDVEDGTVTEDSGPIAVDVIPPDGVVARGMKSSVILRTYRRSTGEPVPSRVVFDDIDAAAGKAAGAPPDYQPLETGRFGLATVQVDPVGDQVWHVEVTPLNSDNFDEASNAGSGDPAGFSTATLDVTTVPSQTALNLESAVITAGPDASRSARTLAGHANSLFSSGRMLADLFYGQTWIGATSQEIQEYSARLTWTVPAVDSPRLFRAQVHRDLYVPASAWDAGYVAALPDRSPETLGDVIQRVFRRALDDDIASMGTAEKYHTYVAEHVGTWVEERTVDRQSLVDLLDAGLRTLPRHFERVDALFNTQYRDRAALELWIASAQSDLLILTALALLIALVTVGSVVVIEIRKRRRHADEMRAVDVELEEAEENADRDRKHVASDEPLPAAGSSFLENVLTAVIFLTFVLFATGLILVLTYM